MGVAGTPQQPRPSTAGPVGSGIIVLIAWLSPPIFCRHLYVPALAGRNGVCVLLRFVHPSVERGTPTWRLVVSQKSQRPWFPPSTRGLWMRHTGIQQYMRRGHIVAATLLTWSCFSNVDLFCHERNIYSGHKFCVLDTTNVSANLQEHLCLRDVQQCCRVLPRTGNVVGHNVAATMCPRFAGALVPYSILMYSGVQQLHSSLTQTTTLWINRLAV